MTTEYGFDAVPRSTDRLLKGNKKNSPYIPASDISVPDTTVVRAVEEYVKNELSPETYNHSVRVYYYGMHDCS
jgi:cyanamide hydratase